ncbi:hypothetical protein [Nocardia sp. NPDC003345]
MDAENASLGDERRAPQEEYGRGQWDSESRGFAGFGSDGFDSANGSNGATNRSDSVPDHGYTWTPAPLSTPAQNTSGSAAMDPFAAWNTSGVIGDAPGQVMTSVGQDIDSRYPVPPPDSPSFSTPPEEDSTGAAETTALPTRRGSGSNHAAHADPAAMPRISQPDAPALSSSSRIPAPGTPYPAHTTDTTVPAGAGPGTPPAGQLPGPYPAVPGGYPEPAEADSFAGSAEDTGSLPSWLSSIGEEAVPNSLETGGRRRKLDLADTGESAGFNPFEDQHAPEHPETGTSAHSELPASGLPERRAPGLPERRSSGLPERSAPALSELPAPGPSDRPALELTESEAADPYPLPGLPSDLAAEQPPHALPTRTSRTPDAAAPATGEQSATPARRLPRSAARHAPATDESAAATGPRDTLTTAESDTGLPTRSTDSDGTPDQLPARRLPRSAGRYKPALDDSSGTPDSQPQGLPATGTEAGAPGSGEEPAEAAAPPRLAPPDGTPILDRLLEPEPAHGADADDSGSPVSEILTRILESGHEPAPSRHSGATDTGSEPGAPELPAPRRGAASALSLVPDSADTTADTAAETTESDSDARPPLETRRSRRAREAAEASAATSVPPEPEPAEAPRPVLPSIAALSGPARAEGPEIGPPADTTSRHGRPEEGADIDIHLIMRLLTASDDLEVLAGKAETDELSADEVARTAREARAALLSAISAWYGGPAQMVKFANALLQAARES